MKINHYRHTCPICGRTFYDDDAATGQEKYCEECQIIIFHTFIT